eukprot:COSAG01_NODE_5650_length_4116_cov_5.166003_5_plen_53_part_00
MLSGTVCIASTVREYRLLPQSEEEEQAAGASDGATVVTRQTIVQSTRLLLCA